MDKQYNVAACLLIKDEGRYLPEWLAWHVAQGVEHFYIYDNGSAVPVAESVPAEYADMVTVVDFPPPRGHAQFEAYADCLKQFGSDSEWMAFIDADEFLRVVDGSTLRDFWRTTRRRMRCWPSGWSTTPTGRWRTPEVRCAIDSRRCVNIPAV